MLHNWHTWKTEDKQENITNFNVFFANTDMKNALPIEINDVMTMQKHRQANTIADKPFFVSGATSPPSEIAVSAGSLGNSSESSPSRSCPATWMFIPRMKTLQVANCY